MPLVRFEPLLHSRDIALADWLAERSIARRAQISAPIVLATWGSTTFWSRLDKRMQDVPAVFLADLAQLARETNTALTEERTAALAGTSLSPLCQIQTARALACRWWSALVLPLIKAIAVDLDETLHAGVIDEDGLSGIRVTPGHSAFQQQLLHLREQGLFLALVSRNEPDRVMELLNRREDYLLKPEHFTVLDISLGNKADALKRITAQCRIGLDAVLFIDDNFGELLTVAMQLPEVKLLLAQPDATFTNEALRWYPGIWRWQYSREDTLRNYDLAANAQRTKLLNQVRNPNEYYRLLGVKLTVWLRPQEHLARLVDLSARTNQFNLALRSYNAAELQTYLDEKDKALRAVSLQDRLSDSGIIALIAAHRHHQVTHIDELCISCRASGR